MTKSGITEPFLVGAQGGFDILLSQRRQVKKSHILELCQNGVCWCSEMSDSSLGM